MLKTGLILLVSENHWAWKKFDKGKEGIVLFLYRGRLYSDLVHCMRYHLTHCQYALPNALSASIEYKSITQRRFDDGIGG